MPEVPDLSQRGGSYQQSSSSSRTTSQTRIVPGMMGVYNQLLALNQANYNNALSIYQQGDARLAAQLPGIYAGYTDLENRVMSTLGMGAPLGGDNWGVAQPAARQIQRDFAKVQGDTQQAMIDAGLGNSTVLANFRNQNTRMTGEAYAVLGANLANYAAGYQRDIGLSQQAARMQGADLQARYALGGTQALLGYQFQNTAGPLTGQFSESTSNSNSMGYSVNPYSSGGGGGGGVTGGYNPAESIARERNAAQQQMLGMTLASRQTSFNPGYAAAINPSYGTGSGSVGSYSGVYSRPSTVGSWSGRR